MILVPGVGACATGARLVTSTFYSVLGGVAFVLGLLALITGSLTPLSLLVADIVVMWASATVRHAHSPPERPIAT